MEDKSDIEEKNVNKQIIISQVIIIPILVIEIILVILLIYNFIDDLNCSNVVTEDMLSEQDLASFNIQWEMYIGENKTETEIKELCSTTIKSNFIEQENETERYVGIHFEESLDIEVEENTEIKVRYGVAPIEVPYIQSNITYTVTAIYGSEGFIIGIMVE